MSVLYPLRVILIETRIAARKGGKCHRKELKQMTTARPVATKNLIMQMIYTRRIKYTQIYTRQFESSQFYTRTMNQIKKIQISTMPAN